MRRTRRGFTQIYFAATKNFAIGNLLPAMHHAAHENRYHYRPRPFGIGVRRFWLELLFEFHSRAAAAARSRWRLFQSPRCQWLHARRRCDATAEWIAIVNRSLRSARFNDFGGDHFQHLDFSPSHGASRPGPCRGRDAALGFSCLELPRTLRRSIAAVGT